MAIDKAEDATLLAPLPELEPARILEIELSQPLGGVAVRDEQTGREYRRACCLVRLHGCPLGMVEFRFEEQGISAVECASHIWQSLGREITRHLQQDGLEPVSELGPEGLPTTGVPDCLATREQVWAQAPFVSVIVSTRDRPESLACCLRSLFTLHYPRYEILVVDNAPGIAATAQVVARVGEQHPEVRYLREERAGLSWARNCGMQAARGEILAFTDDDVVVDRFWLLELVKGFLLAEDVACVTGLVLPLELETPSQFWFEEHDGGSRSVQLFTRSIFDKSKRHVHLFRPGGHGGGANMAFTAAFLRGIGGFDPALGAGRRAGGEDHAALFRAIARGHKLVHEPASLVYHQHRRDYPALRKQVYHYGTGYTAYILKSILDTPLLLFDLTVKLPFDFISILNGWLSKNRKKSTSYPKELNRLELKGRLYGPIAYIQSLWEVRRMRNIPSAGRDIYHPY